MKYFSVTVLSKGKRRQEIIKAETNRDAVKIAKRRFPRTIISKAQEVSPPLSENISRLYKHTMMPLKQHVPIQDKISTIRQIAVMTDAGISITDTLQEVSEHTENKKLKQIYETMHNDINAGNSISDAIKPYTDEFGHVALAMTNLGEKVGDVSAAYHKLANILESIRDNHIKFKKAVRGPMITLVAMAIAFTIIIIVVVPKFKDIFERFKTQLPLPTQVLLKLEWVFSHYGILIFMLIFLGVFVLKYRYKNNEKFKYKIDKMMIHPRFYLINKAIFFSTMHKYNLVFSELVKSGIPVSDALTTAVGMVDNLVIKEQLFTVNVNISRGLSLTEAFKLTGLYENMLLQMIKAGESSGKLDMMLDKVTEYYDREFQNLIDNLSTYIEPIILIFIAGLVLLLALGIFMPIWDLNRTINS